MRVITESSIQDYLNLMSKFSRNLCPTTVSSKSPTDVISGVMACSMSDIIRGSSRPWKKPNMPFRDLYIQNNMCTVTVMLKYSVGNAFTKLEDLRVHTCYDLALTIWSPWKLESMEPRIISNNALDHNARWSSSMRFDETLRKKPFTIVTSDEYTSIVLIQIVAGLI